MEFLQIDVFRLTRTNDRRNRKKESRECQRFSMNPKYAYAAARTQSSSSRSIGARGAIMKPDLSLGCTREPLFAGEAERVQRGGALRPSPDFRPDLVRAPRETPEQAYAERAVRVSIDRPVDPITAFRAVEP